MKVTVIVTREYEMDDARILSESAFEPPDPSVPEYETQRWLRETFYELCGFERDQDHIDGSYVKLLDEYSETEWDWV